MQFNIIFKTIFEYIHKKFRFVHTNTLCKYRKKLHALPRVHLVIIIITSKHNAKYFTSKHDMQFKTQPLHQITISETLNYKIRDIR